MLPHSASGNGGSPKYFQASIKTLLSLVFETGIFKRQFWRQGGKQRRRRRRPAQRRARQTALVALHLVDEDDVEPRPRRDHGRDQEGAGRQQLRLRAARALPVAVRARRPKHRQPGAVGDRGVQAAPAVAQRRPV